jgi:tetratricopeptide (TPR) repeat protein
MSSTEILVKQAISLHQQGNLAGAEAIYKKALDLDQNDFDALHMLGIVNAQRGSFEDAERLLRKAIAVDAKVAPCLHNHGTVLCKLGRFEEAIDSYDSAISLAPGHAPIYCDRGNALYELKRFDQALASYDRAIGLVPNFADAWCGRGNVFFALMRFDEALAAYDRALAYNPKLENAWLGRGNTFRGLGRTDEALAAYDKALAYKPDLENAWLGRGDALYHLGRFEQALAAYDRVLALKPDSDFGWLGRGNALCILKRNDDALAAFDRTLSLNPNSASAWLGRGNVFTDLSRYDEALAAYDKALAIKPDLENAWLARGNVFFAMNRDADALLNYEKAIGLRHENAEALLNISQVKLSLGDFEEGWALYEWRWKSRLFTSRVRNFSQQHLLEADDIAGKTILIHAEQGFGDTIQFYRYIARLEEWDCEIIFEAPPPLVPLFKTQRHNFKTVTTGEALPKFDIHCPLLSLPHYFKTTLATIPGEVPYLFPDPVKLDYWLAKLGAKGKPRIGLVWSGNPKYSTDVRRSVPLELVLPFISPDAAWYSLQKEVRDEDRRQLGPNPPIVDFSQSLNDFSDTAALIAQLDLVTSVDTAVAHLAGALGKPVWILLPFHPDFRWLRDREDSPWYPTARLFRQTHDGDWQGVVDSVFRQRKSFTAGPN